MGRKKFCLVVEAGERCDRGVTEVFGPYDAEEVTEKIEPARRWARAQEGRVNPIVVAVLIDGEVPDESDPV